MANEHAPVDASSVSQADAVNPAALQEFQDSMGEDGPRMVVALVKIYLRDGSILIAQMRQSVLAGDHERLRRAAHTLKGDSNQLGAAPLARLCARLEQLAKVGLVTDAESLMAQLQHEYERVEASLRAGFGL